MGLGLSKGGDARPYLRYSPQANEWQISGANGATEVDMKGREVAIDIQQTRVGWLLVGEGVREWAPWPGEAPGERTKAPSSAHKEGVSILLYSKALFGGEEPVREWVTNQAGPKDGITALYEACEACPEFAAGKTPIVKLTGTKAVKIGKGNSRIPEFEIVKWIDRPTAFGDAVRNDPPPTTDKGATKQTPPPADDEF